MERTIEPKSSAHSQVFPRATEFSSHIQRPGEIHMMNRHTEPNVARFDLRRSKRVPAQLSVVVQGKSTDGSPFADPTRAVVLSAHGCLLTLSASVRLGAKLILRNVANREEQDCRVVYLGEKHGGRTEVGLRFKTAAPQFWGLDHPPPDWSKS